jgi:hypothetical protein
MSFGGNFSKPDEKRFQLRLLNNNKARWQTQLNVLHVGSTTGITKITSTSGAIAEGVLVGSNAVIFNGTESTVPAPTSPMTGADGKSKYDPNRFDKLKDLHVFKSGFTINVPSNTKVFVVDLDPTKVWKVNGATLSVSTSGVASFVSNTTTLDFSVI